MPAMSCDHRFDPPIIQRWRRHEPSNKPVHSLQTNTLDITFPWLSCPISFHSHSTDNIPGLVGDFLPRLLIESNEIKALQQRSGFCPANSPNPMGTQLVDPAMSIERWGTSNIEGYPNQWSIKCSLLVIAHVWLITFISYSPWWLAIHDKMVDDNGMTMTE